jgi:hypothetical protein
MEFFSDKNRFKTFCFCLGLNDRANQVSIRANQVKAVATDVMCNFNCGNSSFIEWEIQATSKAFKAALTSAGLKVDMDLVNVFLTYFSTKLNTLYPGQITNVTFVSNTTTINDQYVLKFQVYFIQPISDISLRTAIISNIQKTYYKILVKYFTLISQTMKIPTSVKIDVPTSCTTISNITIWTETANSTQPFSSGLQLTLKSSSSSKFFYFS